MTSIWFWVIAFFVAAALTLVLLDTLDYLAPVPFVVFVTLALVTVIRETSINSGRDQCENFEILTNYKTKYVEASNYHWTCYAKVDGRWIPSNQVIINVSPAGNLSGEKK